MGISMSGKLPSGDGNGLTVIEPQMNDLTDSSHFVVIGILDCPKVASNKETGEHSPIARIRRIEVVLNAEDQRVARRLMERALGTRTGRETLPYDLQAEIEGAFGVVEAEDPDGNQD